MTPEQGPVLRRAWEYHRSADEVLATRTSLGLVAQTVLLLIYAGLLLASLNYRVIPSLAQLVIAGFALWYSIRQYRAAKEIADRMTYLRERYLIPIDEVYRNHLGPDSRKPNLHLAVYPGLWCLWGALMLIAAWLNGAAFLHMRLH